MIVVIVLTQPATQTPSNEFDRAGMNKEGKHKAADVVSFSPWFVSSNIPNMLPTTSIRFLIFIIAAPTMMFVLYGLLIFISVYVEHF
jgi:hypothetical protein